MTITEKIKKLYKDDLYFPYNMKIKKWPKIISDEGKEPLDMENWQFIEVNDDYIIMQCGGDWQHPHELRIELDSENELTVVSYAPCVWSRKYVYLDKIFK